MQPGHAEAGPRIVNLGQTLGRPLACSRPIAGHRQPIGDALTLLVVLLVLICAAAGDVAARNPSIRSADSRNASSDRICEPMWV